MYTCAKCGAAACSMNMREKMPANCPMRQSELIEESFVKYGSEDNHEFYVTASELEALGYGEWVRLREIMELCRGMNYTRVGMAFCKGLLAEAKIIDRIMQGNGFDLISVICKTGGIPKEKAGISRKLRPEGFEAMCNPIAQAELLNSQDTQLNIVVGLCVGHDSMFYKYSNALVTTLIVKDRVLANNPAGAVYCADGYMKGRLKLK